MTHRGKDRQIDKAISPLLCLQKYFRGGYKNKKSIGKQQPQTTGPWFKTDIYRMLQG